MKLRLVVPADVDAPTGGNVYDLALAAAMDEAGHEVAVVRCADDDLAGVLARPWTGETLVDGLLACRAPDVMVGSDAAVLVHMPLAWGPALSPEDAAHLDQLERHTLRATSAVVATSQWAADDLRRRHDLDVVAVARPGVETAPVVTGSQPPLLVHVAAVLPNKDQLGVVEALRRVADLPWQARLVGSLDRDPRYAEQVLGAIAAAGLETRIDLPGTLAREKAWNGADLALLPSRMEAFGLVVTEALARGIPVVVSRGGAAEALGRTADGREPGFVVPPTDVGALAHVLRRWLTDRDVRRDLRGRALERRDELHGWDVTARDVVAALTLSGRS